MAAGFLKQNNIIHADLKPENILLANCKPYLGVGMCLCVLGGGKGGDVWVDVCDVGEGDVCLNV